MAGILGRIGLGMATGTVVALAVFPASPIRNAIGAGTEEWAASKKIAKHWSEISDAPERRGRVAISIVEFLDYSCTYCKQAEKVLDDFQHRWENVGIGIRFISPAVLRKSDRRALLAICAARRYNFPAMHEVLFDDNARTAIKDLNGLASAVGTSVDALDACFENEQNQQRLDIGVRWAEVLGVRSTPTFVGPGGIHRGVPTVSDLERVAGLPVSVNTDGPH